MSDHRVQLQHGAGCDCRLLAVATHAHPEAIPFSYCMNVLQKRYVMTCRHGVPQAVVDPALRGRGWTDVGRVDAVKAILVGNS
jgi:hypothetical protein